MREFLVGTLHSVILYGFTSQFFEPQFQYGSSEMWTAIIASAVAGAVVGLAISLSRRIFSPSPVSL